MKGFRDYIKNLKAKNDVVEIEDEVSPILEIGKIEKNIMVKRLSFLRK